LTFSYLYSQGQGLLPQVHQVEQQGEGDLQAGGQQGGVPPLGPAQEQAGHELRDHGSRSKVLLPYILNFLIEEESSLKIYSLLVNN
jgi:hypothetical protein